MTVTSLRTEPRRLPGRPAALLLALAGLTLLTACASEPETRPCPDVKLVNDASRQVKFNGQGRDLTDVIFDASITTGKMTCTYDDNELDWDLQVQVVASRGPANSDRLANLNYFVALARTDQTILKRDSFDLAIPFPGNRTRVSALEEVGQVITLHGAEDGGDYRIYVGLELTREEMEYNRANY